MEMEFKPLWGSNFNRAFRKLGVPQECFSQQSHLMTHISTLILRVKTCPWPQKWPLGDKKICMVALFVCQLTNLALCIIPYILNNLPLYFLQVPEWIIWERKKKRLILFCKAGSGMCHLSDGTIFTFILTILEKNKRLITVYKCILQTALCCRILVSVILVESHVIINLCPNNTKPY